MGGGDVLSYAFLVYWWWQSGELSKFKNSYLVPGNSFVEAAGALAGAQGRRG